MEVNKEKIRYILQFFFDKGENASQAAEMVNSVYGFDTVTANYVQFWFRRFRLGIFDVKDAPRTGRPTVGNVDKITEMIEIDPHVSSRSIAQELKIDHKTVLNHLRKAGFKKELDVQMPRRCCVPNCRSNYKGEPYTNVYSFPKNPEMRLKWEEHINRSDFKSSSSSVVCIKHFDEKFIERNHQASRPDGTILIVPRKSPILAPEAYPTIFLEQPSYFTEQLSLKRKSEEESGEEVDDKSKRKFKEWVHSEESGEEIDDKSKRKFKEWVHSDEIMDFKQFKNLYKSKLPNSWLVIFEESSIYFGKINIIDSPTFIVAVKMSEELIVSAWHNNLLIPSSRLESILGKDLKCSTWSAFDCLVSHLNAYNKDMTFDAKLKGIATVLKSVLDECDNISLNETLIFLHEQLELILMKTPSYSAQMLLWASKFYFSNPAAYHYVRDSNKLILPHPYYLK